MYILKFDAVCIIQISGTDLCFIYATYMHANTSKLPLLLFFSRNRAEMVFFMNASCGTLIRLNVVESQLSRKG